MSFFGRLFGSAEAGEKLVDGLVSAGDKLLYTDEEKAEDAAKQRSEGYAVYTKWLESTTGSRIARRVLALGAFIIWALPQIVAVIFATVAIFLEDVKLVEKFTEASSMLFTAAQENNALVGVVFLFYFGGPAAIEGTKGLVSKWVAKGEEVSQQSQRPKQS